MHHEWTIQVRQAVAVKLYRTPDRLVVAAPMPGVRPQDVSVEVTDGGRLILQSTPHHGLRDQLFNVEVTEDRDGDQVMWTHELWQETKEVLLDEWSAGGYYREVDLPAAVDAPLGTLTYGNGVLVVALPVRTELRSAQLRLDAVGAGRGERLGSLGHPVQAAPLR